MRLELGADRRGPPQHRVGVEPGHDGFADEPGAGGARREIGEEGRVLPVGDVRDDLALDVGEDRLHRVRLFRWRPVEAGGQLARARRGAGRRTARRRRGSRRRGRPLGAGRRAATSPACPRCRRPGRHRVRPRLSMLGSGAWVVTVGHGSADASTVPLTTLVSGAWAAHGRGRDGMFEPWPTRSSSSCASPVPRSSARCEGRRMLTPSAASCR